MYSGFSSAQTSPIKSSSNLTANQPDKQETSTHIILQLLLFPPVLSQTSPRLLSLLLISLAIFTSLPHHSGFLTKVPVTSIKTFWPLLVHKDDHTFLFGTESFLGLHDKTLFCFFFSLLFLLHFPLYGHLLDHLMLEFVKGSLLGSL